MAFMAMKTLNYSNYLDFTKASKSFYFSIVSSLETSRIYCLRLYKNSSWSKQLSGSNS